MKKHLLAVAAFAAVAILPAAAEAPAFSALSIRELGSFLKELPADFMMVQPAAAKSQIDAIKPVVLDVRETNEYADGHLVGAVNIPIRTLPAKLSQLSEKTKPIIVYCGIGHRGAIALTFLKANGYVNVKSIGGGYKAWVAANLPTEK
jgi:rhodanese-related sulfurtransferase